MSEINSTISDLIPVDYTKGFMLPLSSNKLSENKYKINTEYGEFSQPVDFENIHAAQIDMRLNQLNRQVLSRLYGQCEAKLEEMQKAGIDIADFRIGYWLTQENMQITFHAVICHKDSKLVCMPDGSMRII